MTSATWIFTFLVAEITPPAITNIGWRTYIIFGVFNVAFIPVIYFFYPETKGLSLEAVDELFMGRAVEHTEDPVYESKGGATAHLDHEGRHDSGDLDVKV